jgi:hypothetical protein
MSEVTHLRTLMGDVQAAGVNGLIEQLLEQVRCTQSSTLLLHLRTYCHT